MRRPVFLLALLAAVAAVLRRRRSSGGRDVWTDATSATTPAPDLR